MGIIGVILFAIVCILFLVALVLSTKTWRWLNIVAMLFLFPIAITFTIMFGHVVKHRFAERTDYEKVRVSLEKIKAENRVVQFGAPDQTRWTPDSIVGLNHRLEMAVTGRGRVWRDCVPLGGFNNGVIKVSTFAPGPALPDGSQPEVTANSLREKTILFVFAQGSPNERGWQLPETYLGEFMVTSATDTEVTLQKSLVLDDALVDAHVSSPWSLYELMPADSHGAFVRAEAAVAEDEVTFLKDYDYAQRRADLETKYLPADAIGLDPDSPEYIDLIDRYAFTDMSLGEIAKIKADFKPTDNETWIRMDIVGEFTGPEAETYKKVDSDNSIPDITGMRGDFDQQGLAQSPSLQRNNKVELKKGDTVVVDIFDGIKGYVDSSGNNRQSMLERGVGKETERIFRRTLNDYGAIYHQSTVYLKLLAQEIKFQEAHNATISASETLMETEKTHREGVRDDLESDQDNLKRDMAVVDAAFDAVKTLLEKNQAKIAEMDARIEELTTQLATLELKWAAEADERTRQAQNASR
jgi:hypothetical protein